ncbi:hypothetical protein BKA70DRAFT_1422082 [Coprinopsis sp. MPI-PUGE-AT-0042]|nr:hypothetical protein BKA70DRAFT_1422082 [Coprinopsis sp. MPI-PUGE-AT-0042]
MLDFTVLSDRDWASLLDFLCLRIMLGLRAAGEGSDQWKRLRFQLEAEVDNACFCMAIAHFYSPTLAYKSAFMSLLVDKWPDVFVEAEAIVTDQGRAASESLKDRFAAAPEFGTISRDASVVPNIVPNHLGAASQPASLADAPSADRSIGRSPMRPYSNDVQNDANIELDISSLNTILQDFPGDHDIPHAWWGEGELSTLVINPLTALRYWRRYCSKNLGANTPVPIIWPSKTLLSLWERYCEALDEVKDPQAAHVYIVYEGGVAQTAEAVDCVVKAALYPIFPNLHRTDKPHDPYAVADLFDTESF